MRAACATETVGYAKVCRGRVELTQEHMISVLCLSNLLDEARVGCCQACGCLSAKAWFETVGGVEYIIAQCAMDPGELELGHRDVPEPDGRSER